MTANFRPLFRGKPQAGFNFDEMVIDNFAGGGGASTGIEAALGRPVDVAINHDINAVRMHEVNHPHTRHYCESVWDVDPLEVTQGRPVGLAWFSPDCTHFSKARGSVPVKKEIRGLAWVALRWADKVRPRIIMLENVEEFTTWGPVRTDEAGNAYPCPKRRGQTFLAFVAALERHGYRVEHRVLCAHEYGAPTIRKRFFLIARCDGAPIVWPEPTHGPGLLPYRTAAECIDWSIPCPSIFLSKEEGRALGVRRPLAENTLRRIATGVMRYVVKSPDPFIVKCNHTAHWYQAFRGQSVREPLKTITASPGFAVVQTTVAPFLLVNTTGHPGSQVTQPLRTVTTGGHHALVATFLAKHYTGVVGADVRQPMPTVTAIDHNAVVASHLVKLRNCGIGQDLRAPLGTITAGGQHFGEVRTFLTRYGKAAPATGADHLGLVTIDGETYAIVDIGMRMLTPAELYRAQGFPADYIFDRDINGRPFTKKAQIARCGNSVSPPMAEALVRANWDPRPQQVAA